MPRNTTCAVGAGSHPSGTGISGNVSGGVTAYDGLRAVGQIIEKTATLGAAIIIGVARSAIKSAG